MYWALIGLLPMLIGCGNANKEKDVPRLFYVNSYHKGYGSSDDVMEGIKKVLQDKDVVYRTFYMDSKRNGTLSVVENKAKEAMSEIAKFKPDVLLVSDDNAVKHLVVPHFNNTDTPVVFCGVNWSAEQYHLGGNVTGMLEVLPLRQCISAVKPPSVGKTKMTVLSENSLSEQNNKILLDTLFVNLGLSVDYALVSDFDEWKDAFKKANAHSDLIYVPTNGAIANWNKEEAEKFVEDHIQVPVITCDDFMMPYAVFGLTKVAQEQGEWAAKTALAISKGQSPGDVPITKNQQSKAWLNGKLAEKLNLELDSALLEKSTKL